MKMKKLTVLFALAALSAAMTAGCSGKETERAAGTPGDSTEAEASEAGEDAETTALETPEEDEENYDTGDASLDNTRNSDGIGENELLAVSFGTSYNDNRRLTVGAIEEALEKAFPDYSVRRGFTSQIIIDHVKARDNVTIDNVAEAWTGRWTTGLRTL